MQDIQDQLDNLHNDLADVKAQLTHKLDAFEKLRRKDLAELVNKSANAILELAKRVHSNQSDILELASSIRILLSR